MNFQVNNLVVMKSVNDKSKSIWLVKAVFTEAIDVVPLKKNKEIKMLQGVYGSMRFRKAEDHEIKAGSRDFSIQ